MNNKEIAEFMNNVEYGDEDDRINQITNKYDKNTVIVYPYSDDNVEFRGAIENELGAYEGRTIFLNKDGIIEKKCLDEDCPYEKNLFKNAPFYIKQLWCKKDGYSWNYETNIPNAEKFLIIEEDEIFGEGLVFNMSDLLIKTLDK